MGDNGQHVGRRLRALRREHSLGLCELAAMAGIDAGSLSRVESGQRALPAAYVWRLAKVLGAEVFGLCEATRLLGAVDVTSGRRCAEYDQADLRGFALPGGIRVLLPAALAGRAHDGRQWLAAETQSGTAGG